MAITQIDFLTPGNYPDTDPHLGLETTLKIFELGESLSFDSAWVRQRHLERGVSSAATFLAAASQRTKRIGLGTAVIQMGYENPFRLAEDLATVDSLSKGRLNVGLSAGAPPFSALLGQRLHDGDPSGVDYTHARVARLRDNLRSDFLAADDVTIPTPAGPQRPRLQPVATGLTDRLWYGGGSLRSADWAGKNGFNLLIGNITTGEGTDSFFEAQLTQLDRYLAGWQEQRRPRVALGRVIVPLDSADKQTRQKYRDYEAGRLERTKSPQGERRTLIARDIVGTSDEILEILRQDPVLPHVDQLRLELPYDFTQEQYQQILSDFVETIAPELGWLPNRQPAAPSLLALA